MLKKYKKIISYLEKNILSDILSFSLKYRISFGRWLNWKNPKTFNEKIIWRIINDKNPLYTTLSDKYLMRNYVKSVVGEKYLVPLLFVGKPEDIDFDNLKPPYVIKTNHTMGDYKFVKDRKEHKELNKEKIREYYKDVLSKNYYDFSREPQYKNIKPLVIIERFLINNNSKKTKHLTDYKFHCFDGKVAFINVDLEKKEHKEHMFEFWRCCFDKEGMSLPFTYGYRRKHFDSIKDIEGMKEDNFKEMIDIAEKLSKGLDYVRVDLYNVEDKVYFGEFTFTPTCGFGKFDPPYWDYHFGELWKLKNLEKR